MKIQQPCLDVVPICVGDEFLAQAVVDALKKAHYGLMALRGRPCACAVAGRLRGCGRRIRRRQRTIPLAINVNVGHVSSVGEKPRQLSVKSTKRAGLSSLPKGNPPCLYPELWFSTRRNGVITHYHLCGRSAA